MAIKRFSWGRYVMQMQILRNKVKVDRISTKQDNDTPYDRNDKDLGVSSHRSSQRLYVVWRSIYQNRSLGHCTANERQKSVERELNTDMPRTTLILLSLPLPYPHMTRSYPRFMRWFYRAQRRAVYVVAYTPQNSKSL